MDELKGHIQDVMLWEFKNNINVTETAKNISTVYGQGVVSEQVQNWFSKFRSCGSSLKDKPR